MEAEKNQNEARSKVLREFFIISGTMNYIVILLLHLS